MSSVLLSAHGSALMVTLSRASALNALTHEMLSLLSAVPRAAPPSSVILRGAGGRAFCAGGDVRAIAALRGDARAQLAFFVDEYRLDWALARHARTVAPHVALWDGIAMGGGLGISAHAPFRVATERTTWAMPETAIGFLPDVGGSFFLPRLAPARRGLAAYLGITGARLVGADAVHAGVATHFVPSARIDALLSDLAALPAPPAPYAELLARIDAVLALHATPVDTLPPFSLGRAEDAALIARVFGPDEGGMRGVATRLAAEAGALADSMRTALASASPTAMAIVIEQLRRGAQAGATLGDCLAMELRVVRALLGNEKSDFYEGVRAVLVDKGKGAPAAWTPPRIDDVDEASVRALFDAGLAVDGEAEIRALGSHLQ
jgi:enoyl-CoA hydratase/carnithine racemase